MHPNAWVRDDGTEECRDCGGWVFYSDGGWMCDCRDSEDEEE